MTAIVFPKFPSYICNGDSVETEYRGFTLTATVYDDDSGETPWEHMDSVTEWTTRDKRPGEVIVSKDGKAKRLYDVEAMTAKYRKDGCTRKEAAKCVAADIEYIKAWCNDAWSYFGVAVVVSKKGVALNDKFDHAIWAIEGNYKTNDYFTEVASDLAIEALTDANAKLAELVG